MPLILAIEPDKRQATQLKSIVRARLGAELVIGDSAATALHALGDRVPDLILTTPLLSPKDEAALNERLHALGGAASYVQTLTIPMLAAAPARKRSGGMLSVLRRHKSKKIVLEGCDPADFAQQCAEYLERAGAERALRAHADEQAQSENLMSEDSDQVIAEFRNEPDAVSLQPEDAADLASSPITAEFTVEAQNDALSTPEPVGASRSDDSVLRPEYDDTETAEELIHQLEADEVGTDVVNSVDEPAESVAAASDIVLLNLDEGDQSEPVGTEVIDTTPEVAVESQEPFVPPSGHPLGLEWSDAQPLSPVLHGADIDDSPASQPADAVSHFVAEPDPLVAEVEALAVDTVAGPDKVDRDDSDLDLDVLVNQFEYELGAVDEESANPTLVDARLAASDASETAGTDDAFDLDLTSLLEESANSDRAASLSAGQAIVEPLRQVPSDPPLSQARTAPLYASPEVAQASSNELSGSSEGALIDRFVSQLVDQPANELIDQFVSQLVDRTARGSADLEATPASVAPEIPRHSGTNQLPATRRALDSDAQVPAYDVEPESSIDDLAAFEQELWAPLRLGVHQLWPPLESGLASARRPDHIDAAPTVPVLPASPTEPERPEWLDVIESVQRDIERLKTKWAQTDLPPVATVGPIVPPPNVPAHAPQSIDASAPAAQLSAPGKGRTKGKGRRSKKKEAPVPDDWGFFDPEQVGFAALLTKLDEITTPK